MKLIVGLGNPGRQYARTRHNIGFRVVDLLAAQLGAESTRTKFKGEYTLATLPAKYEPAGANATELLLVKPQTFMNLCGECVQGFWGYYKVASADLLVVVDDVALPLGMLRVRRGGSDGGHNGLKDIALRLGTEEFARLRIGVGGREADTEQPASDLRDHVLSRFSSYEEDVLKEKLKLAVEACLIWAGQGVEFAMNRYNEKKRRPAAGEKESKDPL